VVKARELSRRVCALAVWAYGVWLLLTWTVTAEQLLFGAVLALIVAVALAPLGPVVGPWRLLQPARLLAIARLAGYAAVHIVRANLGLARRIWSPSRPLRSGMLVVATGARTDGELAATAVIASLIVDNQIVDLDRSERVLQYHAVAVPESGDPAESINAPVERRVAGVRKPR
jgi:multicomponent Na+:H+ antiporter subunit E